jgi:DNA polymerase III subunit delta'
MLLDEIRGQDAAVARLRRAVSVGRLGHALVFSGPPGVGKRTAAMALARALLCRTGEGCRVCPECHLVDAGSHPDLFVEDLEKARLERPTASMLSIEQVRRLRSQLASRALRGTHKVGIVDPADRATPDAQNALLKTLEEPPGAATLILVASNSLALLPTILSRCQRLLFAPLESALVAELLAAEGVTPDLAESAAALSGGSLERARALADEEVAQIGAEITSRLEELPRLSVPQLLDAAEEIAGPRGERGRERKEIRAAMLLERLREEMIATAADPEGDDPEARLAAVRRAWKRLASGYETWRDLEQNANPQLAWNRLLFDLRATP